MRVQYTMEGKNSGEAWEKTNPNNKHFELWNQAFSLILVFHTKRNVTEMNESEMRVEIIPCQRLWDVES